MQIQNAFLQKLEERPLLFMDGATGTMLQAAGMPAGIIPEEYVLSNPDILRKIHIAYAKAGADGLTTCTFGANAFKLPPGTNVFETNKKITTIAKEAAREAGHPVFIAGDVGPSGVFAKPLGDVEPEKLISVFEEQIRGLVAGGADLILIETQFDLAEARAAVVAARKVCNLPIMASMTFENGVSLTGSTAEIFAETMLNLGVDVVGTNCSLGPVEMLPVVSELVKTGAPIVMAQPNAGLPQLEKGKTIFPLGPEEFAEKTAVFAQMGARILGGCCGTTPDHIRLLKEKALNLGFQPAPYSPKNCICLTSRSSIVRIGHDEALAIIGERINPTGKPALTAGLQKNDFTQALRFADEQIEAGAAALDVNVGAPLVNEAQVLPELVCLLTSRYSIPLSLDSSDNTALAKALPYYPASCLVNSISGEGDKMSILGPLCRDFGAPFILLPLQGAKLPVKAKERIAIAEKLLQAAEDLHIPRRLIMVDILALAVSSKPEGGKECLEMARWCRSHNLPTTIGLSNVSFGLPARELLNSVFLCLAAGAGLNSCIANPCASRIREAADALKVLNGYDPHASNFIDGYSQWQSNSPGKDVKKNNRHVANLYDAVLFGDKENIISFVESELKSGKEPFDTVNNILIPAITEVGSRYERKEYFLPQLIRSAESMQAAFAYLKPLLEKTRGAEKRPVIVMATVEGDIHDIGKNIVSLLLGNHGFEVVDAGKDVPAAQIIECAEKHGAKIIGLSALMTTTMARMADTINIVREKNLPFKIMVGGAAVTQAFADSIGADAYCEDAVSSVAAAKRFMEESGA